MLDSTALVLQKYALHGCGTCRGYEAELLLLFLFLSFV